jgi:hypothetical protein
MIRPLLLTVASATLAIATPIAAFASDPTADPAPAAQAAPVKATAKTRYCITEVPLGSHMQKKTCQTREEWRRQGVDLPEK